MRTYLAHRADRPARPADARALELQRLRAAALCGNVPAPTEAPDARGRVLPQAVARWQAEAPERARERESRDLLAATMPMRETFAAFEAETAARLAEIEAAFGLTEQPDPPAPEAPAPADPGDTP